MKLEVTREVVSDLWPLVRAGEASADSRTLVDGFLADDESFAERLRSAEALPEALPPIRLSPDAELRLLDEARGRARLKLLIIGGAVALVGLMGMTALGGALLMFFRSV